MTPEAVAEGIDNVIESALAWVDTHTDVEEISDEQKFEISPNPASDYIEIIVGNTHAYSLPEDLKIYNSLGECVMNLTPALSEGVGFIRIDVSQLPTGVYFVKTATTISSFIKN
jgi:hypothetical protein